MDKGSDAAKKVVVAVKASKEIPRTAIVWALTHVVQPGDCITLLVVVAAHNSGRKFWGFPRFSGDCAHSHPKSRLKSIELRTDLNNSCSQMMLQLNDVYDADKINVKVKIVPGSPCGIVAAESKRVHASWVVLDKRLKHEEKHCMENLQCNVVAMKRSKPKVLRLVLAGSSESDPQMGFSLPIRQDDVVRKPLKDAVQSENSTEEAAVTQSSSPEVGTSFTCTEAGASSVSSSDPGTSSPISASEIDGAARKEMSVRARNCQNLESTSSDSDNEQLGPLTNLKSQQLVAEILSSRRTSSQQIDEISQRFANKANASTINSFQGMFSKHGKPGSDNLNYRSEMDSKGSVREAVTLSRNAPQGPPLCSICQHKAPVFGKPPRWFSYAELELATGGFSKANFLAEGGFGSVHRGVLADGQAVAVKQHKLASSQGDQEFCSEVEVLSCAQHRNVVMLIGFCVEDGKRLLVYEFICNGSLDSHLYGCNREPLEWAARHKIAVGAARGLRYLHEECRVGCIVHRDMRPNNILITHDYEPQVGDFGLARWQPHGDLGVDTRVIGTFGYLAPEYTQSGQITEKADVYSFGVVLVELITGRKAVDMNRPKGEQCLTEWARRLLEKCEVDELVDRRLRNNYSEPEVYSMMHAASMCIRHDSNSRPRMSQVLRILEGDHAMAMGLSSPSMPDQEIGSRSNRILGGRQQKHELHSCPIRCMASDGVEGRVPCGVAKTNY